MSWSLNEVESLAKRATRGVGYPWGVAEEAAMAVRWLSARDVDGAAALVQMLTQVDGKAFGYRSPEAGCEIWRASSGTLCPLLAGAALSDFASYFPEGGIETEAMWQPILMVPFAAALARNNGKPIAVLWGETTAITDGDVLSLQGPMEAVAEAVHIAPAALETATARKTNRAKTGPQDWVALMQLAHRTYAPASEESRMSGAGAGLCDND